MKKNKQNTLPWLYVLFFIAATVLSTVFFALLYLKNADLTSIDGVYTTVLFKNGAATLSYTVFACLCVFVFFSAFLVFRKNAPTGDSQRPRNILLFLRAAAGLFILSTDFMLWKLNTDSTPFDNIKLKYAMMVLALPAALYFLLPVFSEKAHRRFRYLFGAGVVGWLCVHALCLHFFMLDFLNSPTRTMGLLGICALIFFFLSDVPYRASGAYLAFGMTAGFLAITDGSVKLLLSLMGQAGFSSDINVFFALCRFTLGLYAAVCTVALLLGKQKEAQINEAASEETVLETSEEEIGEAPADAFTETAEEADIQNGSFPQEASNENAPKELSGDQENI